MQLMQNQIYLELQVISSFLGLRIEGFGGPGARNWRTPHGGGGHEHPQGWEQGEHHSTDPRTAENALPPASRGLRSGGTTERSSAKEISDLLPEPDANRASHVRGVMGWGVQNTYLKGFRRRLIACLPYTYGCNGEISILRRRQKKDQLGGLGNKLQGAQASGHLGSFGREQPK